MNQSRFVAQKIQGKMSDEEKSSPPRMEMDQTVVKKARLVCSFVIFRGGWTGAEGGLVRGDPSFTPIPQGACSTDAHEMHYL